MGSYLRYFTFLPHDQLTALDAMTAEHPERREAQRVLAREVSTLVHGAAETERAERAAAALFGEDDRRARRGHAARSVRRGPVHRRWPGPSSRVSGLSLVDLLVETGMVPSKGRARTTIEQGGAYVNNRREADVDRTLRVATTSWPGDTWCCVVAGRTTTCSASPDQRPRRAVRTGRG